MYEIMRQDSIRAARFADGMKAFTNSPGLDVSHVVNNYDWAAIDTMVDVGGSAGQIGTSLAVKFPNLNVIVQDMESVIQTVKAGMSNETEPRVEFMVHDFFTEQPIQGADVYFFRWILHNWSDKYCVQILRNLIPALKNGARILIQ